MPRRFFGFDVHNNRNPTRPWWWVAERFLGRRDGAQLYATHHPMDVLRAVAGWATHPEAPTWRTRSADPDQAMAEFDRACPMQPPPPKAGQVWIDTATLEERLVVRARELRPGAWRIVLGDQELCVGEGQPAPWPLFGDVLAAGQGGPWAPPDYVVRP